MPLITVRDLRIGFRGPPLLDGVSCQIEPGQRIGLLGRNGAGKTTFMRILSGEMQPDAGEVAFAPGTRMSLLPQDVPADVQGKVHDVIATGIPHTGDDHLPEWQIEQRIEQRGARARRRIGFIAGRYFDATTDVRIQRTARRDQEVEPKLR